MKKRTLVLGKVELTSGNIYKNIILFVIPVVLTGVLQDLYHIADNVVVGNMGGTVALSAIGATGSSLAVLTSFAYTIFVGMNIILARQLGAGDDNATRTTCRTGYVMALILGVAIFVLGEILSPAMMRLTNCPEGEIFDGAVLYMRIYFICIPFSIFSNYAFTIIRVMGDSRSPFIYLTLSGLANVVLNIIFVLLFGNAVLAVALATLTSIVMSAVMSGWHLMKIEGPCKLNPFIFEVDASTVGKIALYGIPAFISSATYGFSNLFITPAVNSFGEAGISGATAANSIERILYTFSSAMSSVAATFIGQNIGADKKDRVKKSIFVSYLISAFITIVIGVLGLIFMRDLIRLFIPNNEAAVDFAAVRLKYVFLAAIFQGINGISVGVLQAYGLTILQMIINLLGVLVFRIVWMSAVFPQNPTPEVLWLCYPVSWFSCGIVLILTVTFFTVRYMRGKKLKI